MSDIQKIKSFIDSLDYGEKKAGKQDAAKGKYPFITISRETGAGGHSVATAILAELEKESSPILKGWQVIDQEICKLVCEEPGLKVSVDTLLKSEYHSPIEDMIQELMLGDSPQDIVVKKIFQIVRNLAMHGKVILVGRAGCCLTQELPLGMHVRLVSSLPSRVKRMMRLMNLSEKDAKELVQKQDKGRQALMSNYFNKNINDPLHYDAIFNTDRVSVQLIAKAIVRLIKEKAALVF